MTETKHTAAHAAAAAEAPEEAAAPAPAPLAAGDVVSLCVSGCPYQCVEGCPDMTVMSVTAGGRDCCCCWFDKAGGYHERTFPVACLVRPEDHRAAKAAKAKSDRAAAKAK